MVALFRTRRIDLKSVPTVPVELDSTNPLAWGLAALWPLSGDVRDYSRNARRQVAGALTNSPQTLNSAMGPLINYNGTNQYVNLGTADYGVEGALSPTGYATMSAWAYSTNVASSYILCKWDDSGGNYTGSFGCDGISGKIAAAFAGSGGVSTYGNTTSATVPLNSWHHVVVIWNPASVITVYLDGVSQAFSYSSQSATGPMRSSGANAIIGGRWNSGSFIAPWYGQITQLSLWNRALSQSEITRLYLEPFCLLRPVVRRQFYFTPPSGFANATTWNPSDKYTTVLLSNGNLTATAGSGTVYGAVRSIASVSSGKYYWENTLVNVPLTNQNYTYVGIADSIASLHSTGGAPITEAVILEASNGVVYNNNTNAGVTLGTLNSGQVICMALDMTAGRIWFRIGASGQWNGNPTYSPGGTGGVDITGFLNSGNPAYAYAGVFNGGSSPGVTTANFGATAFVGAVPPGFTAGFGSVAPSVSAQTCAVIMA